METALTDTVSKLTGSTLKKSKQLTAGSFTSARKWFAELEDGRQVFIKEADDPFTKDKLRKEYNVYSQLSANFIPKAIGLLDGSSAVLVRENVDGNWPPPWTSGMIEMFSTFLNTVSSYRPINSLPKIEEVQAMRQWSNIAPSTNNFPALELVSKDWLDLALPRLLNWDKVAHLAGNDLVHLDIRGDNICFTEDGIKLVDWDHACQGNAAVDRVMWLINLHLEGGPQPWQQDFNNIPIIAVLAGFFAHDNQSKNQVGLKASVRNLQKMQCMVALEWLTHITDLPRFPN